jgi:hypothetical protein
LAAGAGSHQRLSAPYIWMSSAIALSVSSRSTRFDARKSNPLREIRLCLIERERVGEFEIVRASDHVYVALNENISMSGRIIARFADEHSSACGITAHLAQANSERFYYDISHLALSLILRLERKELTYLSGRLEELLYRAPIIDTQL